MNHAPDHPRDETAEINPAEVNNRGLASDGGKIAVAAITEWLGSLCAAQPGFDQFTDIAPLLLGDWCDTREWLPSPSKASAVSPTANISG